MHPNAPDCHLHVLQNVCAFAGTSELYRGLNLVFFVMLCLKILGKFGHSFGFEQENSIHFVRIMRNNMLVTVTIQKETRKWEPLLDLKQ
jgi:hypothetical protein